MSRREQIALCIRAVMEAVDDPWKLADAVIGEWDHRFPGIEGPNEDEIFAVAQDMPPVQALN